MADRALKILCVFIFLPFFALSGCDEPSEETAAVITDFSADFIAVYNDAQIKGELSCTGQGMANISITYPDTLSGLSVSYRNSEILISRENLQCSADEAYVPDNSFPALLHAFIKGVGEGRYSLSSQKEGEYIYTLRLSGDKCSFAADESGYILNAKIKNQGFEISFSSVKANQQ
ncbi:MAG: hypothetical protein LUF33_06350 [Clostridiales bacterium]|nr:hypothetical protein [Clostridiales bacterium]